MIISASRRTDIPAFYTSWFLNRLDEGYVRVRNPFNPSLISRISLASDDVDCIVFWTRNPRPLIERFKEYESYGIPCYFHFTITGYGRDLEPNLPRVDDAVCSFVKLSELVGSERIIWRYDPVIFTDTIDLNFHRRRFSELAARLEGYTLACIMSFITLYAKCRRRLRDWNIHEPDEAEKTGTAAVLRETAACHGIELMSCAETVPLAETGVRPAACIDGGLVQRIAGRELRLSKDRGQRKGCGCVKSVDIGAYDTCLHGCRYCYAVSSEQRAHKNYRSHDPGASLLKQ